MRGMRQGAPRSSRRALTPRRVGAHPARVSARLRLDAPRRGRNGGGVGSDAVAGGAGADWATCLRLLERAAAAADVARDGAASTAALSTRVGGVSLRSGRRTERDKKSKKTRLCYGRLAKHNNQPKTHARDAGGKCEEVRPVRSEGGARFDRWGR